MCPPTSETASFFFLGTSQHRVTNKNAITALYRATKRNYKDSDPELSSHVCLFDGVGSNPQGKSSDPKHLSDHKYSQEKRKANPMPGRYIYNVETRKKILIETTVLPQNIKDLMKRLSGTVAGEGIDELLFEAILRLEQLKEEGKFPKHINLHGFSRGADTCVRLANLLNDLYPELKVNLFLIDHVSGPGHSADPQAYTIPANVQHFESVTMLHEYRPYFDPQDKSRYVFTSPTTTEATFKVYPGGHGKGMNLGNSDKSNQVARLLHDDLFRFAKKTGSLDEGQTPPDINKEVEFRVYEPQQVDPLEDEERFRLYTEILENWGDYSAGVRLNTRNILQQYELNPLHRLFVNQEHAELFAALYPNTYKWFYRNAENSLGQMEDLQEKVNSELNALKDATQKAPLFYERFCEFHKIKDTSFPGPGFLPAYSDHKSGTPLVNDELSYLKHAINSIINYENNHRKYYSFDNEVAIRVLKNTLKKVELFPPDQACHILRNSINSSLAYLKGEGHKQYLYHQLSKVKLELGPRRIDFDKIIEKYFKDSDTEEPSQEKNYLDEVSKTLEQIEQSELTYLQKSLEAKKIINQAVLYLEQQYGKDEEKVLKKLINELNQLTVPSFDTPSLAFETAKLFAAYNKRNLFLEMAHKILSKVTPIKLPFVSPEKSAISKEIYEKLESLDSQGEGNDLKKISDILSLGQTQLHMHYQNHFREHHYLNKGEFDKILMMAKKRVIEQMTGFSIAKNTESIEQDQPDSDEFESFRFN
ncbi:Dot/Icm T4SS effector [Legionella nautarum]|uniref:Dot/Icm T4SS effector n=1 Tax=Legionella nautarum TaxID=45070 RepID=A0A0W0WND2_9GAMM|nr:DUF5621 domain-containing protein [Legionella nautarum]KTD33811.1 Dot/Icm T4SS effector [Legionella nautarum]